MHLEFSLRAARHRRDHHGVALGQDGFCGGAGAGAGAAAGGAAARWRRRRRRSQRVAASAQQVPQWSPLVGARVSNARQVQLCDHWWLSCHSWPRCVWRTPKRTVVRYSLRCRCYLEFRYPYRRRHARGALGSGHGRTGREHNRIPRCVLECTKSAPLRSFVFMYAGPVSWVSNSKHWL
jgi:hypothetical protein